MKKIFTAALILLGIFSTYAQNHMTKTLTKTVNIHTSPDKVWDYVSDLSKWPEWAIHNVKDSRQGEKNYWLMTGPRGVSKVKLNANKSLGLLDHEFIDPGEGRWVVHCRVVAADKGAHLMITFTKPEQMPMEDFEKGMKLFDEELAMLKRKLEE